MASPSSPTRAERLRQRVTEADDSPLVILAAATGLVAGIIHLIVTPMHFGEAIAQGIFFAVLGTLQVVWGLWMYRRPTTGAWLAGIGLALGSIVLWVVAVTIRPPFQDAAEAPEPIAWVCEAVQALTLVALVGLALARPRGAPSGASRAMPLLVAALLLGLIVGGGAYGAGLVGEKVVPGLAQPASDGMGADADHGGDAGGMQMSPASTDAPASNASTNSTAGNGTAQPQYDYSACMPGMDMPGCPASVAAEYYAKQQASAPPPDKDLPPVKIELTPQGDQGPGKFTVDNGTKQLIVSIRLNDSGAGPYAALGPGGQGDLTLDLKGPAGSKTIALAGSANTVGVDPAAPASKGPYSGIVTAPGEGAWTITVNGQGQNANVVVSITERFTS